MNPQALRQLTDQQNQRDVAYAKLAAALHGEDWEKKEASPAAGAGLLIKGLQALPKIAPNLTRIFAGSGGRAAGRQAYTSSVRGAGYSSPKAVARIAKNSRNKALSQQLVSGGVRGAARNTVQHFGGNTGLAAARGTMRVAKNPFVKTVGGYGLGSMMFGDGSADAASTAAAAAPSRPANPYPTHRHNRATPSPYNQSPNYSFGLSPSSATAKPAPPAQPSINSVRNPANSFMTNLTDQAMGYNNPWQPSYRGFN